MDLKLSGLPASPDLGQGKEWVSKIYTHNLLTAQTFPSQAGHRDIDHDRRRSPRHSWLCGPFIRCSLTKIICTLFAKEENAIWMRWKGGEDDVSEVSCVRCHGFVRHAGASWKGYHAFKYHMPETPKGSGLKDAMPVFYCRFLWLRVEVMKAKTVKVSVRADSNRELMMDAGRDGSVSVNKR